MAEPALNENVRYEPNENPPPLVATGAAAQAAILIITPVLLTVVIVMRIATNPTALSCGGLLGPCW